MSTDSQHAQVWVAPPRDWFHREGAWWLASFVFHMLLMATLMLVGTKMGRSIAHDDREIETSNTSPIPADPPLTTEPIPIVPLDSKTPLEPLPIVVDPPAAPSAVVEDGRSGQGFGEKGSHSADRAFASAGPLGDPSFVQSLIQTNRKGLGPSGGPAVGPLRTTSRDGGPGAWSGRHSNSRHLTGSAAPKAAERSVAASLSWIARHQLPGGSWSLGGYTRVCKDATCSGAGQLQADSAATALALLPFLGAGQTHETKGPYRQAIYNGLYWLLSNQKKDGDLRHGSTMYAHALATICLCEAYGLSGDKGLGQAAQRAVNFIQAAQNSGSGGWRYQPGDDGDTSVVGWQVMALKSAQMAYLNVDPKALEGARRYLASCASGSYKGLYAYQPAAGRTPTMTAVGALCSEYLGAKRGDPALAEGVNCLMANPPDGQKNLYYWYYATQVMHNILGPDWDAWNRKVRRVLVESQGKDGCATGSWNPAGDPHGARAGRLYQTSLSALTLEVYYRYLPLYQLDPEAARPSRPVLDDPKPEVVPKD